MRWLKDWTAQGKVSPQLSLVISTAPGQLTTVREARAEVRKLVDSAFERGKLVLPVLNPACNEVSSGSQERSEEVTRLENPAQRKLVHLVLDSRRDRGPR